MMSDKFDIINIRIFVILSLQRVRRESSIFDSAAIAQSKKGGSGTTTDHRGWEARTLLSNGNALFMVMPVACAAEV